MNDGQAAAISEADADAAVEDADEALPAPEDPYWDDITDTVFGHLRRLRAETRRQGRRDRAFVIYVVLLLGGTYGSTAVARALRNGLFTTDSHPPASVADVLPILLTAATAAATVMILRSARWRGPVLIDQLTLAWIMPLPVRWERVLRPRLRRALLFATFAGAGVGACVGLVLCLLGAGAFLTDVLVAAPATGLLAAGSTALAGIAMTRPGVLRWLVPAASVTGIQTLLVLFGVRIPAFEAVAWWCGPWTWAAQLVVKASGTDLEVAGVHWPTAAFLLTATAVVAVTWAWRTLPHQLSGEGLRERGRTATHVSDAMGTANFRQARLAMRGPGHGAGRSVRWRPRPPRARWLVVAWRDLVACLSAPGQAVGGLVAWGTGVALTEIASDAGLTAHGSTVYGTAAAISGALTCGYLAATQWVEPARTDADDLRRSRLLPFTYASLTLRHAVLPLCVAALLTCVGAAIAVLAGASPAPVLALGTAMPALIAAALVSANKGTLPLSLLIGAETAFGNTAPAQVLLWYVRAPLAACVLLIPVVTVMASGGVRPLACVFAAVVGLLGFFWAWWRARRLYRNF